MSSTERSDSGSGPLSIKRVDTSAFGFALAAFFAAFFAARAAALAAFFGVRTGVVSGTAGIKDVRGSESNN